MDRQDAQSVRDAESEVSIGPQLFSYGQVDVIKAATRQFFVSIGPQLFSYGQSLEIHIG